MKHRIPSSEILRSPRAERLAALVKQLAAANQSLRATMTTGEFRSMTVRMAEQQLIYEEFGHEPR